VAEAAEGDRMNDAVAVALEGVARTAAGAHIFGVEPTARDCRIRGESAERPHRADNFSIAWPASLVQL
jgi:hypothetical protein